MYSKKHSIRDLAPYVLYWNEILWDLLLLNERCDIEQAKYYIPIETLLAAKKKELIQESKNTVMASASPFRTMGINQQDPYVKCKGQGDIYMFWSAFLICHMQLSHLL